jgi:hypothetical protein
VAAGGAAPPVWDGMVSVGVDLSRPRCGDAVEVSRGNRTAIAGAGCNAGKANSRVLFDPFPFTRAEVDVAYNAGYVSFGVRESDSAAPSPKGDMSHDVLVVGTGCVYARGTRARAPAEFRPRAGETFTIRLDRAARVFYCIVRGVVSPAQFTDLSDGPLEFVAFLGGGQTPPSQLTIVDVRVDAASAAVAAPGARTALLRAFTEVSSAAAPGAGAGVRACKNISQERAPAVPAAPSPVRAPTPAGARGARVRVIEPSGLLPCGVFRSI